MSPDLAAEVLTRAIALPPLPSLIAGMAAARQLDDARSALGILEVHLRSGFLIEDTAVRMAARRLRGVPVVDPAYCPHDYAAGCPLCPLEASLIDALEVAYPPLRAVPDEPVECCASGKCEICAPGGFGGSRYWT